MIKKGNRSEGVPYIIENNEASKLVRVSFSEKEFKEVWIQELIHSQPDILPVDEIEPIFSPLISIGKEVATTAGYIDNLYISPEGYLTVVETKLWRNPEARREVVGQIIDYAKALNKWTFTDLNNSVKAYNQQYNNNNNGIIETIRENGYIEKNEIAKLIDKISLNLKRGRFLLLIVGDGIRESVEEMVEYLNQPLLYFTLALIELQVYKFKDKQDSMLVIPQVVTRTTEIIRAIVRFEGNQFENINVSVPIDTDEQKKTSKRFTIAADDFFNELELNSNTETVKFAKQIIEDSEKNGYFIDWGQGSFIVRLFVPNRNGAKISMFVIDKKGMIYLGWAANQLEKLGLKKESRYLYAQNTANLFSKLKVHSKYKETWERPLHLMDLKFAYERFMNEVDKFANKIQEESDKLN